MSGRRASTAVATVGFVRRLTGWRRLAAAFVLGALGSAAMAPFHIVPALIIAFTGLLWLLDGARNKRAAFALGWWFGFGYFVPGLYWISSAFFVDAERFAWLAPLPVIGLPAGLAFFPALATALAAWRYPKGPARVLWFALCWALVEYARARILTGFPWNAVGYTWAFSPETLSPAAFVGIEGLGFLTVIAVAMPVVLTDGSTVRRSRILPVLAAWAALGVLFALGEVRRSGLEIAYHPDVKLRIVQANIPQREKWQADKRPIHFALQVALSSQPGAAEVSHFVWPETAVPYFLNSEPRVLTVLGQLNGRWPGERHVITGALRRSIGVGNFDAWNSAFVVDRAGEVVAHYDKIHLVPFGEFLPLRGILKTVGLDKLAAGPVDFKAGEAQRLLDIPGLPKSRILVCYEAIFPGEIMAGGVVPGVLFNLTNDAWFGRQTGPYQHFAMARSRAVEFGVPVVRAANTGISAVIDPTGEVLKRLDLGVRGIVDARLPIALSPPPYARLGDWVPLSLWLVVAALALLLRWRGMRGG